MNLISIIIGLIALILVGVMATSFPSMGDANAETEKERLRRELELMNNRNHIVRPKPKPEPVVPEEPEPDPMAEVEALRKELEDFKENERARTEAQRLEKEAEDRFQAALVEPEPIIEAMEPVEVEEEIPQMDRMEEEKLKRRAKLITQAMVMGTVEQYYPSPDDFITLDIINYENIQEGVTLAIRRNTGIVGQVRVTTVESEKAVASVLSHTFLGGEVVLRPGDELIIPPL